MHIRHFAPEGSSDHPACGHQYHCPKYPCRARGRGAIRTMSQTTAADSLIDPVLDALQIILDGLKPHRVVDNVQRYIAI